MGIGINQIQDLQPEIIRWMNDHYKSYENSDDLAIDAGEVFGVESWLDDPNHEIYKWAEDFICD